MSAATINRAANDPELQARVLALAHKEMLFNEALADTDFGRQLAAGFVNIMPLMWPIAVDTEAAYEAALQAGRGSPGHDSDIITDGALTSAITTHWPYTDAEMPQVPPP